MTLPAIEIPSLRPSLLDAPFPGTELPDLPAALDEVRQWIDAAEEPLGDGASRWHAWPDRPEFTPIYGPVSLNTGAAGIAWYANAATALDPAHAARASRAAAYLRGAWRDHADDVYFDLPGTGLGHYGGLAGIASVFVGLGDRETAVAILDEILRRTGVTGGRPFGWTGSNALLGDGGIVITLVDASAKLGEPRYLAAAVTAGLGILAEERPDGSWPGVSASSFGMSDDIALEGFELGTIGIGYVFAKLAVATGDPRFAQAATRAAAHVAGKSTVVGDAAVIARVGGDYSFGYCTGSSGVIRSFVGVYRATGDPDHLEWALRFGRGILRSGVPGRQTRGNAYVFHQCCGSAAVLESFVGLWRETGDPLWLRAAQAQADDLLIRSIADARGRRWYSEAHILPTGTLKAEVGHQVGASGIALALLHLHQALQPDTSGATPRLPDDPF